MPTKSLFHLARPLPLVAVDQIEQRDIVATCDGAVTSSRIYKTSILIATATAGAIAILSVSDPVILFANVTAMLDGNSGLHPEIDQSKPTMQFNPDALALVRSTADAQPLTAMDAPTRDEAVASEPALKDQTEKSEPLSALFKQFQAWAAAQDAQAHVAPMQTVQDAPAQVVKQLPAQVAENARVPHRLVQKHRRVVPVHVARAEMRTRKQDHSVQNDQALSFLTTFGARN
jgi:hypothetical protein